jgi:hypothetical protein
MCHGKSCDQVEVITVNGKSCSKIVPLLSFPTLGKPFPKSLHRLLNGRGEWGVINKDMAVDAISPTNIVQVKALSAAARAYK